MTPLPRRMCAAAVTLAAVLVPAASAAAAPGNPQVARINPTTGVVDDACGRQAVDDARRHRRRPHRHALRREPGPDRPNPAGAGIYSLTPPTFGVSHSRRVRTRPTSRSPAPRSTRLTARAWSAWARAARRAHGRELGRAVLQYGIQPQFGAVSGGTMYVTASGCGSAEAPGGSYVIAVTSRRARSPSSGRSAARRSAASRPPVRRARRRAAGQDAAHHPTRPRDRREHHALQRRLAEGSTGHHGRRRR